MRGTEGGTLLSLKETLLGGTCSTERAVGHWQVAAPAQTMTMEIGQFSIILRGSKAPADHDDHDAAGRGRTYLCSRVDRAGREGRRTDGGERPTQSRAQRQRQNASPRNVLPPSRGHCRILAPVYCQLQVAPSWSLSRRTCVPFLCAPFLPSS